ncbi:uracil-xanthine permease family protein [Blautia hansenii]|uniref:Permease n=1 Tax=Blautia hansenii DSM 20583 TaxID=537007 RepID=C9L4V7_BLAHA|nr:solute carrier family 23 protein [Blautia hansenii]ASM68502.1 uracil permease [Blautia hansenii DSM 20583]EEX22791.1 putative permease [Blautia hansenii DSM 20583]UWO11086.1 NCS2 family nucleobase:cation symporter [Blautia hansenii DSM 20583]
MQKKQNYSSPYKLEGKIPLGQAILYGLQHVMAMFVGNLTPVLLITGACALDGGLQLQIIQNAMLMAGVITLLQLFTIGPVGAKLPIVMGTSSGFIGVCSGIAATMGQGIVTYGAIIFASFIGGLFETVLGFFLKPLRRFFPALVTGTVVMAIGLSLISVGINSFGGGNNNGDFGSLPNLFVGTVVLVTIILLKHFTKGVTSTASILIGIIVGYIVCGIMGIILPTTYQYVDPATQETVTKTCSWVLDFSKVSNASWFAVPAFMPFGFSKDMIDLRAIIPIVIMFIVTAVETVGDTSAITEGGLGREATDKELSGSVICDGLGSSIASFFGVLPNTSFSQNVGLIAMTKIVNLFAISTGAIFLVLCGLFPKLAAIIQMMPQSVLGGAAVMMFASIVVSGIQLVTKDGVSNRTVTIVSVALGLGYGLGANAGILANLPQFVELIFGGSGIVPAAIIAMILNIAIPQDKETA